MTDIVERLHDVVGFVGKEHGRVAASACLASEAADEIERLRNLVKELATALEFEANYEPHKALARSALEGK